MKPGWRNKAVFILEAALVYLFYGLMALLPLDMASGLGGWIARCIGPLLPITRKVGLVNLRTALPGRSPEEYRLLMVAVWDNLGRTFGEYPHLTRIVQERLIVEGAEHLDILRAAHRPGMCISCHSGNWEICPALASHLGLPLATVYRAPNNPWVDRLLRHARRSFGGALLPKGASGAKAMIATLQAGGRLGLLVDQKMNDGIAVPFFGRSAMTAPAVVQLALRYRCPVIPAFVERLTGARFRVVIQAPLVFLTTGDRNVDLVAGLRLVNQTIEAWVRAHPGQWLWLHRRWPQELL